MPYNQEETVQHINPTPVEEIPAQGGQPASQPPRPANHMAWAILVTIFGCCHCLPLIFGIISIVYASKVNRLYDGGQVAEAYAASRSAKTWAIVATVLLGLSYIAHRVALNSEAYQSQMRQILGGYGL